MKKLFNFPVEINTPTHAHDLLKFIIRPTNIAGQPGFEIKLTAEQGY